MKWDKIKVDCKCGLTMRFVYNDGWMSAIYYCMNCGRLYRKYGEHYGSHEIWMEHVGLK